MPKELTFNSYQEQAIQTLVYPNPKTIDGLSYIALGLNGEAGEVAEKVKKILRDKGGNLSEEDIRELKKEAGDVLWYTAGLCYELDTMLEDVAQGNIDKLNSRKERNLIGGSGDNR